MEAGAGSLESSVLQYLRAVRNGEGVKKMAKKDKSGIKNAFRCDICNVTVYDAATFELHLKGKKHRVKSNNPVLMDGVSFQSNSNTCHAEKARYSTEIVAAVSKSSTFQHVSRKDKKIRRNKYFGPPRKILRMDDPPCSNVSASISGHTREKNSGVDQHEKRHSASDEWCIKSDCRKYKKCKTGSHLTQNGFKSPFKITCNKDLYNFLQYFQISDEIDVIFIQKIVKKLKNQLQEFYENAKLEKATFGLNGSKNQEKGILKIACPTERTLEQAESASNSVSLYYSSDMLCDTTKKPMVRPSVLTSVLNLRHQSIIFIKKEPDSDAAVEEPQLDCTSFFTSKTNTDMFGGNVKEAITTGTLGYYLPVYDASNTLGKLKSIIRPSAPSSVSKSSLLPVFIKKEPGTVTSDECQGFPAGYTGTIKALGHSPMLQCLRDQLPSMCLETSSSANKNKLVTSAENPKTDHLNCPPSPVKTFDAYTITFGGKKNMPISEVIAEIAEFADTKPCLQGIDINQVVRILIQNRSENSRKAGHNSTL